MFGRHQSTLYVSPHPFLIQPLFVHGKWRVSNSVRIKSPSLNKHFNYYEYFLGL